MKRLFLIHLCLILTLLFAGDGFTLHAEIGKALGSAMAELNLEPKDRKVAVLTNLGYVEVKGSSTREIGKVIEESTGCNIWDGNLLFFQSSREKPLRICVLRKDTADLICITSSGGQLKRVRTNIALDRIVDKKGISEIQNLLGPDTFSIVSILSAWSLGAPRSLLTAGELHNHICPGLTHGYMIANFIMERFPITEKQSYTFISCPPWCKDDAIQRILDLTPGKRNFYVISLSEEQKKNLVDEQVAGILVIRERDKKDMRGFVIKFDSEKLQKVIGATIDEKNPMGSRLKVLSEVIPIIHKHGEFVSVVKEFDLDEASFRKITQAGSNPYKEIGFEK